MLSLWFKIRHMIPTVTKLDSRNVKVDTDECFIYKRTLLLIVSCDRFSFFSNYVSYETEGFSRHETLSLKDRAVVSVLLSYPSCSLASFYLAQNDIGSFFTVRKKNIFLKLLHGSDPHKVFECCVCNYYFLKKRSEIVSEESSALSCWPGVSVELVLFVLRGWSWLVPSACSSWPLLHLRYLCWGRQLALLSSIMCGRSGFKSRNAFSVT